MKNFYLIIVPLLVIIVTSHDCRSQVRKRISIQNLETADTTSLKVFDRIKLELSLTAGQVSKVKTIFTYYRSQESTLTKDSISSKETKERLSKIYNQQRMQAIVAVLNSNQRTVLNELLLSRSKNRFWRRDNELMIIAQKNKLTVPVSGAYLKKSHLLNIDSLNH